MTFHPSVRISILYNPWPFLLSGQGIVVLSLNEVVHIKQEINHLSGPHLFFLFEEKQEFPKVVSIAQSMLAGVEKIRFPEVVDEMSAEVREYPEMISGNRSAFFVDSEEGQRVRTGGMEPVEFSCGPCAAFIDMEYRGLGEFHSDGRLKRSELFIALFSGRHDGGLLLFLLRRLSNSATRRVRACTCSFRARIISTRASGFVFARVRRSSRVNIMSFSCTGLAISFGSEDKDRYP